MASDPDFVQYVCEQARLGAALTHRRMFGEYALYVDGKVVGLVCDNQLYVKPLDVVGPLLVGAPDMHPPFPGARPFFRITAELDEAQVLGRLLRAVAEALPMPKPKGAKKAAAAKSPVPKASAAKSPSSNASATKTPTRKSSATKAAAGKTRAKTTGARGGRRA